MQKPDFQKEVRLAFLFAEGIGACDPLRVIVSQRDAARAFRLRKLSDGW